MSGMDRRVDPAAAAAPGETLGDHGATPEDESLGSRGPHAPRDPTLLAREARRATRFDTRAGGPAEAITRPCPYTGPDGRSNALGPVFASSGLLDGRALAWVLGSTRALRAAFLLARARDPRTFFEGGVKPRAQGLARAGFRDHLPVVTRLRRVSEGPCRSEF